MRAWNSTEIYVCRAANCWLAWKQKSLWINAMCLACVDICYLMDHHVCAARCHRALALILSVSFSQWERETWLQLEKYRPAFLASGKTQTWALSVSNYPVPSDFRDCRWDSQAQTKTLTVTFWTWTQHQTTCRLNISTGQGHSNVFYLLQQQKDCYKIKLDWWLCNSNNHNPAFANTNKRPLLICNG